MDLLCCRLPGQLVMILRREKEFLPGRWRLDDPDDSARRLSRGTPVTLSRRKSDPRSFGSHKVLQYLSRGRVDNSSCDWTMSMSTAREQLRHAKASTGVTKQ